VDFYKTKKMNILKGFSKYIIIGIIGILLAFFVAWIQYDTTDLSASVLSLTEQDFFESTQWDA
jgi:putative flippase GtrA